MGEAIKAEAHGDVPVGAIIIKDGIVIAKGHNLREKSKDPSAHAEIVALRRAAKKLGHWNLSECSIYVTLEPCPMCAAALVQSRIAELIYAAEDLKGGAISLGLNILNNEKLNHHVKVRKLDNKKAAGEILSEFFRKRRLEKKSVKN